MTKKRIAVIGSEDCGLSSVKWCLDEDLESVCFERTDDIGGLCRYQDAGFKRGDSERLGTNSKPPSVKKRPDFSTSGQREVVTECEGKKEANIFDGVMVCTGHHTNAHLPMESFPGIEKFKGQYFHSQDYKNPEELAEKRVFIIFGNSGGDLAVEISYTVKQLGQPQDRDMTVQNKHRRSITSTDGNGKPECNGSHTKDQLGKQEVMTKESCCWHYVFSLCSAFLWEDIIFLKGIE
ncbi:Dimethylaniline monooxygenase [N-oxide-forming] 5 [Sciurus carolinensis]|uniref:Flavin-containing monooxygenase n=1 Tax=Sciurus carolinensis TaxID=30640 RepID=A0AA41NFA8_SCICA|nr:Dimethylaniline monooxygenase [N-oxide-forming] 5 [Sciurus carolinensis]